MNDEIRGLLIPADSHRRAVIVPVPSNPYMSGDVYLGGDIERTQYDYDAAMYVNETGAMRGLPLNTRATDYIRNHSDAAKQGRMRNAAPEYGLYGPVLVVGEEAIGDGDYRTVDVPERLIEVFMTPEQGIER